MPPGPGLLPTTVGVAATHPQRWRLVPLHSGVDLLRSAIALDRGVSEYAALVTFLLAAPVHVTAWVAMTGMWARFDHALLRGQFCATTSVHRSNPNLISRTSTPSSVTSYSTWLLRTFKRSSPGDLPMGLAFAGRGWVARPWIAICTARRSRLSDAAFNSSAALRVTRMDTGWPGSPVSSEGSGILGFWAGSTGELPDGDVSWGVGRRVATASATAPTGSSPRSNHSPCLRHSRKTPWRAFSRSAPPSCCQSSSTGVGLIIRMPRTLARTLVERPILTSLLSEPPSR